MKVNGVDFIIPSGHCYKCKRCSECCKCTPHISNNEIDDIRSYTGLDDFYYLDQECNNIPKILNKSDGYCLFLSGSKCLIHTVRPNACRLQPFYPIRKTHDGNIMASVYIKSVSFCDGVDEGNENDLEDLEDIAEAIKIEYQNIRESVSKIYDLEDDDMIDAYTNEILLKFNNVGG